LAAVVTAIYF